MKGRKIFWIFAAVAVIAVAVAVFAPWGERDLTAYGTAAGNQITNAATITWGGGLEAVDTNIVTITTNFGAFFRGQDDASGLPSIKVTNHLYFTNDGNSADTYILTHSVTADQANGAWTYEFWDVEGTIGNATSVTFNVAYGGYRNILFIVTLPADVTNGSYREFQVVASNGEAATHSGSNYTSLDGTTSYGGTMALYGAGYGRVYATRLATADTSWRVSVAAATVSLTKTVAVQNVAVYAAETTLAYPGARLTYQLFYTNTGSADAANVLITDYVPTSVVTYVANSLKIGTVDQTYATATGYTDALTGDAAGWTSPNAYFSPGGVINAGPVGTGSINAQTGGNAWLQVYVN